MTWGQAKQELMKDFNEWIKECENTRKPIPEDMIEFLYQKYFIKGKQWKEYVNKISKRNREYVFWVKHEPLREGFIPPDTLV